MPLLQSLPPGGSHLRSHILSSSSAIPPSQISPLSPSSCNSPCISHGKISLPAPHRADIKETLPSLKKIARRPLRWKWKSFPCSLAYVVGQRLMMFSGLGTAHHAPISLLFDFRRDEPVLSGYSQLRESFFRCAGHCCLCLGGLTAMSHAGHAGWNNPSMLRNALFPRFLTPETQAWIPEILLK